MIDFKAKTACATCTRYKPDNPQWRGTGMCTHPDGPTKVHTGMRPWRRKYPPGCPIDPAPPKPPRKRPGKKKRKPGPKHRPDVRGGMDGWGRPRLEDVRAPTVDEFDE